MTDMHGSTNKLNDLLDELHAVVETLQSAAEEGASVERTLQFGSSDEGTAGVMGVRVETGIGGATATVRETMASVQSETEESETEASTDVRRPAVEVHEEEQRVRVVAEMPGVAEENLTVTVDADALVLSAETDRRTYRRAVSLPGPVATDEYTVRVRNGLVELVFSRDEGERDETET